VPSAWRAWVVDCRPRLRPIPWSAHA